MRIPAWSQSLKAQPTDLVDAIKLIPNSSLEWLADGLILLPEERRPTLLEKAYQLLAAAPEEK